MPSKLRFVTAYLQYRLRAQNRHGLHSPFVYTLLDEVIYDFGPRAEYSALQAAARKLPRHNRLPTRVNRLIYRLARHFGAGAIHFSPNVNPATVMYLEAALPNATHAPVDASSIDLWVTDAANPDINYQSLHPRSIILVTNIYGSPASTANWQVIKQHPDVTVTINLFWFGLVFFRPGQAKEHFTLRF